MISWLMIPTLISVRAAERITKLSCLSSNDSIRPAVPICHGSTSFQITFPECLRASALNSPAQQFRSEGKRERMGEALEGKRWNKECSNNRIIYLNAAANYRDGYGLSRSQRILVVKLRVCWADWRVALQEHSIEKSGRAHQRPESVCRKDRRKNHPQISSPTKEIFSTKHLKQWKN